MQILAYLTSMQAFHKEDISVLAQIFTAKMFAYWSHQMGRVVSCIACYLYMYI